MDERQREKRAELVQGVIVAVVVLLALFGLGALIGGCGDSSGSPDREQFHPQAP